MHIPVIANGKIWNLRDALRCRELSGCHRLMLGRGMVTDPGLAIRAHDSGLAVSDVTEQENPAMIAWPSLLPLMADFWMLVRTRLDRKKQCSRLKQWLNFLRHRYAEAELAYQALRTVNDPLPIDQWIETQAITPVCA